MKITQLQAHEDNYIYMVSHAEITIAIDPGDAEPVLAYLEQNKRTLSLILNTHMHQDHCGGNLALKRLTGCHIAGGDKRIAGIDHILSDDSSLPDVPWPVTVLQTPGHTGADCSYYFPEAEALFCGDTLFSGGCGRVFEGTMEQLFHSLKKLSSLPETTRLFCGHEYTEDNYRFAASIEPGSAAIHDKLSRVHFQRNRGQSTLPVTLAEELVCNPFLRCHDKDLRHALKMEQASDLEIFTDLRLRKNRF
nr:hydroxyacylglutathione hydrolase [uncultured Desulfuromonas sp.]